MACRRARQPHAERRDARPADDDGRLPRVAALADPLRMFDSCLISDGGAAFVTTTVERARDLPQPPAIVEGVGEATRAPATTGRSSPHSRARRRCSSTPVAFEMAGIDAGRRRRAHVLRPVHRRVDDADRGHGLLPEGRGRAVRGGRHAASRRRALPYNTHGGLLCHTYVLGIAHVVELVKQLRGVARRRRCPTARSPCTAATPDRRAPRWCSRRIAERGHPARRLPAARPRRAAHRAVLRGRGRGRAADPALRLVRPVRVVSG